MKKTLILFASVYLLAACQYEKAITGTPTVTFDEESLTVQAGYSFDVTGMAQAAAGIQYISVKCAAYSLDKTYDLSKYAPESYRFCVTLTAPVGISSEEKVTVEVTGADGSKVSGSLPVIFEGDADNPVITVDASADVQLSAEGTALYSYSATLEDNQGLSEATLICDALSLSKTWTLGGKQETVSADIPFAAAGNYTLSLSVTDITGNTGNAITTVTVWPADAEAPVIAYNGTTNMTIKLDAASVDFNFGINVSDNQRLVGMRVMLVSPDWATTYYSETPDVYGKVSYDYAHTFNFTELGDYLLYVYVNDASSTVQSWGNSAELYVNIHILSPDTQAPSITMNSAASVKLGEPYTLSLTFADESGIPECWPKVTVYNANGTEPTEIASNWDGWWPTVSGTSVTAELALTFTEKGEYKVWIDPVADAVGNTTAGKEWFTISVTEDAPADPISVKMVSATTAAIGTPYTVEIKFEAAAGFVENWPKISLWGDFDPWPTLINLDWFTLTGGTTTYTYTKEVTFATAGNYTLGVYADANFADTAGNSLVQGMTFTISVE